MNAPLRRRLFRLGLSLGLAALGAAPLAAYDLITTDNTPYVITWEQGTIALQLKLPAPTRTLTDGAASYNASVQTTLQTWNGIVGTVQFTSSVQPAGVNTAGNRSNEIVMADKVGGEDFATNTLAVTVSYTTGDTRVESDIVFNAARSFDSYRGPLRTDAYDIQRVALHELGHVLGLGHPDEAGQTVTAIMNSRIGNLYELQTDDINGAQTLYGAPASIPGNDSFANALTVEVRNATVSISGRNTQASKELGEPNHAASDGGRSVWWRFTAPASGRLTATTLGSNFDTLLAAYTGATVGTLTVLASNDDAETPEQNPNDDRKRTSIIAFDVTAGTVYHLAVDGWDGLFGQITLNLTLAAVAGNPPTITTQPVSRTVTAGTGTTFSVTASGSVPSYQWYFNGTAITGATGPEYTITNAQTTNAGSYHVVVSNFYGTVTSNTVQLTVNPAPIVTTPTTGGGGGGRGGGAPSAWFLAALAALGLARRWRQAVQSEG